MILVILIPLFVIWLIRELYWKRRHLPPGPTPLPLIGNIHNMLWHSPGYDAFANFKKEYGPIYTFWSGPFPMVLISDYQLLQETFVKDGDSYVNKFQLDSVIKEIRGGYYGIVDVSGEKWRDHRRFALHQLRDLGLGKNKMEERILLEVDEMLKTVANQSSEIRLKEIMRKCVANVINQLLFGYRFDESRASEYENLMELMKGHLECAGNPLFFLVIFFEFPRKLPIFKGLWEKVQYFKTNMFGFFERQINDHKKEINFESCDINDYVDAYLKEQKKREEEGDFESFCDLQLQNMCFDLWSAGLETTAATLNWTVIYLLNHLEVQEKMQKEMDEQLGDKKHVTMTDKNNLPYTYAVVNEAQRLTNLLPLNVPHQTTRDVEVNGFKIPKGTTTVAQISTVLYDEKVFPDHLAFKPERFLDEEGQFRKPDELIPFSIGKRQCLGEGIARMELFLFIANFMRNYTISSPDPPAMKKTFTTTFNPVDHICTATSRKNKHEYL